MKLRKITTIGLALVGAAVLATSAQAQLATSGSVTYTPGDLLIGFEESGVSSNYVFDLGAATNFTTSSSLTFNLPTADLSSVFGSTWAANNTGLTPSVQWGVIGGSSQTNSPVLGLPKNTLFYTQGELVVGTQSSAPLRTSNGSQNIINGNFLNAENGSGGFNASFPTINSTTATIEPTGNANSWTTLNGGNNGFGTGSTIEQPTAGSFTGPTNSVLDLYELVPTSTANQPGTYLGNFSLNSSGALTFTGAAVPEPSTYALLGLGALLLVWRTRRKSTYSV